MGYKVGVLGGGSWATALVKILTENLNEVNWFVRSESVIAHIQKFKHNPNYISSAQLATEKISLSASALDVINKSDVVVLAVPAAFVNEVLSSVPKEILQQKIFFSAIKGIVPSSNKIVGEYLIEEFGVSVNNIGVITGPCHAEEVAMEKLSYLTIASENQTTAKFLADAMQCRYINTTVSDDIYGTEYSAVLKNIMAMASGICHGLGYGDNFQAVLISNAIQEIKRFVDTVHPITRDINDHAYLGDLLVTAYSQFSRNRTFGNMIGKGYSVKFAQMEMNMIAEGYYAAACIHEVNKQHNVKLPICEAVYNILYLNKSAAAEISALTKLL